MARAGQQRTAVAALAGRRIDAHGAEKKQFPLENVPSVRSSLEQLFGRERIQSIVSSAACGADLLGLEVAIRLEIAFYVVLPFPPSEFRQTSVIDRPGDWGAMYDLAIKIAAQRRRLIELDCVPGDAAYQKVNNSIIEKAIELARPKKPLAITVWEQRPRSHSDLTSEFQMLAHAHGLQEHTILTC